jgi:hypothetical protein
VPFGGIARFELKTLFVVSKCGSSQLTYGGYVVWGVIYLSKKSELSTQVLGISEGRHHVARSTKYLIRLGGLS